MHVRKFCFMCKRKMLCCLYFEIEKCLWKIYVKKFSMKFWFSKLFTVFGNFKGPHSQRRNCRQCHYCQRVTHYYTPVVPDLIPFSYRKVSLCPVFKVCLHERCSKYYFSMHFAFLIHAWVRGVESRELVYFWRNGVGSLRKNHLNYWRPTF